jgi:SEC-C motif domain protein
VAPPPKLCPCESGLRYAACCGRFHRGLEEAPDAPALMRSRYAAFAVRDVAYLWRTLHPQHPDRARPEAEVTRELREAASRFHYTGLKILDSRAPDAQGRAQVLFLARLFRAGKEHSFVERSDFLHDGTGWRYVGGEGAPLSALEGDPETLTLERFRPEP